MNKIINNKKAKLFMYISVLGFIIALISFFFFTFKYQVDKKTGYLLGETSVEIINSYNKAEELNMYLDLAGKNSMFQTLYETGKKGGLSTKTCGPSFGEYNYWRKQGKECYPEIEEVKDSIINSYYNNLRHYLSKGPELIDLDYELILLSGTDTLNAELTTNQLVYLNTTKSYQKKEEEEENVTISISLKPATRIKIDYNISAYELLSERSKQLFEDCKNNDNLEECIKDQIHILNNEYSTTGFVWNSDCDSKAEHLFYGVLELMYSCFESTNNDCLCTYNLSKSEQQIEKYGLKGDYVFQFPKDTTLLKLKSGNLELKMFVDDTGYEIDYPQSLSVTYSDSKLNTAILTYSPGNYLNIEELYLYKEYDSTENKNVIRFLQELNENTPEEECQIEKNIHRICIEDNLTRILAYDKLEEKFAFRNPEIRFAFQFPDKTPPPTILTLGVNDEVFAEQSMILEWDPITNVRDMDHYNIYCGLNDFTEINGDLKITELLHNTYFDRYNFTLTQCGADSITDLTEYYIAVTGVDTSGNENKEVISVLGVSIDDLPPDYIPAMEAEDTPDNNNSVTITWTVPETNADESELVDLEYFLMMHTIVDILDPLEFDPLNKEGPYTIRAEDVGAVPGQQASYVATIDQGIIDGKRFCFVVIPYDEEDNPKPDDIRAYGYDSMQQACGESINTDNE